jgi:hypothetical protein
MNPPDGDGEIGRTKAEELRYFQELGYRVFAVVDNESDNIAAMAELDIGAEILFLHANNLFRSQGVPTSRTTNGNRYDTTRPVSDYEQASEGSLV